MIILKVELVAYSRPVNSIKNDLNLAVGDALIAEAISYCYRTKPSAKAITRCLQNGHTSVFEHLVFTFSIKGISRACLAQLTRHRIASYTVESQRYVNYTKKKLDFVIPDHIPEEHKATIIDFVDKALEVYTQLSNNGIAPEDARMVLPQAAATNLTMSINARSLFNLLDLRLDKHAQKEIRELAEKIVRLVYPIAPITFQKYKQIVESGD